jgi:hypothetical protein
MVDRAEGVIAQDRMLVVLKYDEIPLQLDKLNRMLADEYSGILLV